jgi:hypothetical protein
MSVGDGRARETRMISKAGEAAFGFLGGGPASPRSADRPESAAQARLRHQYQTVHQLAADGCGAKTIARQLNLARGTVRRYLVPPPLTDLLNGPRAGRPSLLDAFTAYLQQRLAEGETNATELFRQIAALGY